MKRSAIFSADRRYRYRLTRVWDARKPMMAYVLLNSSTADETRDDPTVKKLMGFTSRRNAGGFTLGNLFAVCATDPTDMLRADDPVGPDNRDHLEVILEQAKHTGGFLVCGWGVHGQYMDQDRTFLGWCDQWRISPMAFRLTKMGHPEHPLYVPFNTTMVPFTVEGKRECRRRTSRGHQARSPSS